MCAMEMMEAGVVELAMRAAVTYHDDGTVVPLARELLTRMAWYLTPAMEKLPELINHIQPRKVNIGRSTLPPHASCV